MERKPVRIFVSYAREDESYVKDLENHLSGYIRSGRLEYWWDPQIPAGEDWSEEICRKAESADIFLFFLTSDFLASKFIHDVEIPYAEERRKQGKARVIPIFVRPIAIEQTPLSRRNFLPKRGGAVQNFLHADVAWAQIAKDLADVAGINPDLYEKARPPLSPPSRTPADPLGTNPDLYESAQPPPGAPLFTPADPKGEAQFVLRFLGIMLGVAVVLAGVVYLAWPKPRVLSVDAACQKTTVAACQPIPFTVTIRNNGPEPIDDMELRAKVVAADGTWWPTKLADDSSPLPKDLPKGGEVRLKLIGGCGVAGSRVLQIQVEGGNAQEVEKEIRLTVVPCSVGLEFEKPSVAGVGRRVRMALRVTNNSDATLDQLWLKYEYKGCVMASGEFAFLLDRPLKPDNHYVHPWTFRPTNAGQCTVAAYSSNGTCCEMKADAGVSIAGKPSPIEIEIHTMSADGAVKKNFAIGDRVTFDVRVLNAVQDTTNPPLPLRLGFFAGGLTLTDLVAKRADVSVAKDASASRTTVFNLASGRYADFIVTAEVVEFPEDPFFRSMSVEAYKGDSQELYREWPETIIVDQE